MIQNILTNLKRPKLYTNGTAVMWTDDHISKQLLEIHLNENVDLASRKQSTIELTVSWILSQVSGKQLNILDLGCGPGLYAEKFAEKGHKVTGVDFSKSSIDYAVCKAKERDLDIEYVCDDYLNLDINPDTFDLVILVYTDFGVLRPIEREKLLSKIKQVLKPGGTLVFDVLNDVELQRKLNPKSWEASDGGFWRDHPYLTLSESFFYEKEKVILYQHKVIDEQENIDVYRFWTHFFSHQDLALILEGQGFEKPRFFENVFRGNDLWSGEYLTFCVAKKP
ncbi:class I SAM-dependent methyltransferase [Sunxiuqinia sp. A32]|uniref:class I SAM-dependent methyltransferase n=1 Tax=Sunxiuqinia sp. A32 TaxID=3461496 RepID=UPI004045ADF7